MNKTNNYSDRGRAGLEPYLVQLYFIGVVTSAVRSLRLLDSMFGICTSQRTSIESNDRNSILKTIKNTEI